MKKTKVMKVHEAHTANTKMGVGNYYGTGIKARVGRSRDDSMINKPAKSKIGTPPKKMG